MGNQHLSPLFLYQDMSLHLTAPPKKNPKALGNSGQNVPNLLNISYRFAKTGG